MQISVIIPTYNRAEFLKDTILSLLNQTYKADEIIVVDDGSTDCTKKIVDGFKNIRYIYKENGGVSSARNLGIKKAKNSWLAFIDSDDRWHKDKLLMQMQFHQRDPIYKMSYTNERWIRNKKEVKVSKKYAKPSKNIFEHSLSHCIIAPSSALIHRVIFEKVGLFDESLEVCEDYDMWLRIALHFEIGLIDKPLMTKYAGHDDQLSFKYWGMDRFRVDSLEKLLSIVHDAHQKELIENSIRQKISILIKGAKKHKREKMVKKYEEKLLKYT